MSNNKREILPNNLYHVYNRGVEKRTVFYNEHDYNWFLDKMLYYKFELNMKILAYAILPNHWHFLLEESEFEGLPLSRAGVKYKPQVNQYKGSKIAKFLNLLTTSYTMHFNIKRMHKGGIFQGPFKSKLINDDAYLISIIAYINLNPVKHKIVDNIDDWPYTSHHDIISKISNKIVDKNEFIDTEEYREIIKDKLDIIKNLDLED